MQQLTESHGPAQVTAAIRFLAVRTRGNPATLAVHDDAIKVRDDLRLKTHGWEDGVDESRGCTAEVRYCDGGLDGVIRRELVPAVDVLVGPLSPDEAKTTRALVFNDKKPAEGMKPVGGPEQAQFVTGILAQLGQPRFASLAALKARIETFFTALDTAETNRVTARANEQVVRGTLDDAVRAAREFYNQAYHRLQLLLPKDPDFVESCFLDLRNLPDDQSAAGRKRVLMDIYRARIGPVPREVQSSVTGTEDDATFEKLVALFATKTAEEIAAAVVPPKKA
jgi:hypothetical protein